MVMRSLSDKMQAEISGVLNAATASGGVVRIYAEAERIRRNHLPDNVALEDIVEALMGSIDGLAYSFDPEEAADALLGRTRP
jgi:hypothetical protein